jgi:hypothetical protein
MPSRRIFIAAGLAARTAAIARSDTRPDMILFNGRFLTMEARWPAGRSARMPTLTWRSTRL